MDSKPQSPRRDDAEAKAVFRKPNRNYRRRSPSSGSPTSHGSPKRERSSSPILPKGDPAKASEHQQRRKDDEKDLDRDSGRNRCGRSGGSFRHSSRSSHSYSRHGDYSRHEKRADSEGRHHYASSNSGRESRNGNQSDQVRQDSDHSRSRDYTRGVDKYSRDKYDSPGNRSKDKESESLYGRKHTNSTSEDKGRGHHRRERDVRDEKKDYHKNSGDQKSDRAAYYEESREYIYGIDDGHRLRGHRKNDPKELNDQKERKKRDKGENGWDNSKSRREQIEDESGLSCENQESSVKKPRPFSSESDTNDIKDLNEKQSSSSKLSQDMDGKGSAGQAHADDSNAANDLNAAKVAAMKAAELVNKNLVGVGFMSTEQKKKLLWGSKKSTAPEESGYRWDSALVGDRDRQEKFNKLMGVKGELVEHKVDNQDGNGQLQLQADKQEQLQLDLEKQYTAGLRRRDGRTVGLGL